MERRYFQRLAAASTEICAPQRFRLQTFSLSSPLSLPPPSLSLPLILVHVPRTDAYTYTFVSFPTYPRCNHNMNNDYVCI